MFVFATDLKDLKKLPPASETSPSGKVQIVVGR
jgi:hypothetical protein